MFRFNEVCYLKVSSLELLIWFCFSATSGRCTNPTITAWAGELSAYIKTIDSNHLVAIGDEGKFPFVVYELSFCSTPYEGFFNDPGNPVYVYQYVLPNSYLLNEVLMLCLWLEEVSALISMLILLSVLLTLERFT